MKKIVFYLLVMFFIACTCKATICDTIYPPAHLDDYILPSALRTEGGCFASLSDTVELDYVCMSQCSFTRGIYTVAVPYYSDTLVSIYGIGIRGIKDYENLPNVHLQIRDSLPENVLRSKDTSLQIIPSETRIFTEVFFDTPVTVQGLYHVSIEFETYDAFGLYYIGVMNLVQRSEFIQQMADWCGRGCHSDYAPLYKRRGNNAWNTFPTIPEGGFSSEYVDSYYSILMIFPIRGELVLPSDTADADTASSALRVNPLSEESVRVYPNPASEELNVASDYNILNVEIFDAMNRLVEEREVNAKSVRISLAQRSAGVYFIKVRTDRGSTMRKFVIR